MGRLTEKSAEPLKAAQDEEAFPQANRGGKEIINHMVSWEDSQGRSWRLVPTVGHMLKLKRLFGIDLLAPKTLGTKDINSTLAVLEVILDEQLQHRFLRIEDLADELLNDMQSVYIALSEGITLFFWAHQAEKLPLLMSEPNSLTV